MLVNGKPHRTIWLSDVMPVQVQVIDQRHLPHRLVYATIPDVETAAIAIKAMWVRGAPLICATAAWGMYLAAASIPARCDMKFWFEESYSLLLKARPTAVNLKWALDLMLNTLQASSDPDEAKLTAMRMAKEITEADVRTNAAIGEHGYGLLKEMYERLRRPINILTHCNAGWLATVDWGTATAPIYKAAAAGIPLHVWVDETRPRNQGAALTAWELQQMDIPHTLVVDNAGGRLMQEGKVDVLITGTDRVDNNGNVCNKIGTYLKALAAADNNIPFFVALPSSTIDWRISDGLKDIPVEYRDEAEVLTVAGSWKEQSIEVSIAPQGTRAANPAFDITPAKYVTGFITEAGICEASRKGLLQLFPDRHRLIQD